MPLTHDDNGNLTDDGLFKYKYDAWNRLVGAWHNAASVSDPNQAVATYAYDGLFRRIAKIVSNQGVGLVYRLDRSGAITGVPAGNRQEHYYYSGWRLVEMRNGSGQTLGQYVYGTQYIDELVRYDRNTDAWADNDCIDANIADAGSHPPKPAKCPKACQCFTMREK